MADSLSGASSELASPAMAAGLTRLWARFLPEVESRLEILSQAAIALSAGVLQDEEREPAHAAAHKLAGVLGTFGLHRGTELARQAEILLANPGPSAQGAALASWVDELRILIAHRS